MARSSFRRSRRRSRSTTSIHRSRRHGRSNGRDPSFLLVRPMNTIEVKVPDIGDFKDVPVIEVFVRPGDTVDVEDPLVTLESDKATMDVPSPSPGVVEDVKVKIGDRVSEGSLIVVLGDGSGVKARPGAKAASAPAPAAPPQARGGNGG